MELNIDFFKVEQNISPEKGKILISEPYLSDQFFERSVVFLTEHNDNGSVGFILNKPTKLSVDEVIEEFPSFRSVVSIGGPVASNTLHYMHTLGEVIPESIEVLPGLFWGGDFEQVKFLIESKIITNEQIRFFIGYSGWSPNQLERELQENSWLVGELEKDVIIKEFEEDIWKNTLNQLGKKYKLWADFPENPSMN